MVVGLERLLAHQTVFPISGNSRDLVRDLCDFSGLGTFRQVLPVKKSQHLLLDPFQGSLLHHNFILSKVRLQWHRNWRWSTKSASGYPRCGRQTLSLILTRQSNNSVSLCWFTFHLDTFSTEHSNTDFSNIYIGQDWKYSKSIIHLIIDILQAESVTHSFTHSVIHPYPSMQCRIWSFTWYVTHSVTRS